ncbi:MAG: 2-methylaconitate cis-trans isomerase PrpF [Gammaproteobacteria bacterium]|nr:MAG: 2-methylaconitate cis-trans isomerase PrpF [Gammaproteobacteria bacterium]
MPVLPACWMRGGTSKGLFIHRHALPPPGPERDRLLLAAIGSPDPYRRQIDGLGGATSSTSKVVIIGPSSRPDCDVDYLFGHVAIDRPLIDWSGNCGNLTSAVGVFAIEEGLVPPAAGGVTEVRVWQENLGQRISVLVPTDPAGGVVTRGDCRIAGVPGSGAPIRLLFHRPGGGPQGSVLPTGRVRETLRVPGLGPVDCSLVHAGNATVFITPETLNLEGGELPAQVDGMNEVLERVEAIRRAAAVEMGLAGSAEEAAGRPGVPKVAWVSPPRDYVTSQGERLSAQEMDLCARIFSLGRLHHAFTGTGAIATAVAAAIPGTLVREALGGQREEGRIRIGHTAGVMEAHAEAGLEGGRWVAVSAGITRTARTLMRGEVPIILPDG